MGILKKIEGKPESKISEDDHPKRPDITKREFVEGANEIYERNKDRKAVNKKSNRFARATIKALNTLKMLLCL